MQFFDTNLLVYCHDPKAPSKQVRAAQLLSQAMVNDELVLSTQVLQEFYNIALVKRLRTPEQALALCRAWAEFTVVHSTPDLLFAAFALQQRYQMSVWDALVVQAALHANCTTLYSEDLQHGMQIAGLRIINPFAAPAAVNEAPAAYRTRAPAAGRGGRARRG